MELAEVNKTVLNPWNSAFIFYPQPLLTVVDIYLILQSRPFIFTIQSIEIKQVIKTLKNILLPGKLAVRL
jgi:hypothetical protein